MAEVKLSIAERSYIVTCRDGEEAHLEELGSRVDQKAREASGTAQGLNESRMLLFAALLLADQVSDQEKVPSSTSESASPDTAIDDKSVEALEKLADRIESLASSLEE